MSAANRSAILGKVHKVLRKHYEPVAPPSDRSLLEHLLYASLLEHGRHDTVDDVYAKLQNEYFDWNEVRVTSVAELAERMAALPDAGDAAKRLKRILHSVFETHYAFDIEFLKKQAAAKTIEVLAKYGGVTPFVIAYVTQNALGGHAIPVNSAAIALLAVLGVVSEADAAKFRVPGLERTIPKNKGVEFAAILQQFSVEFAANPQSAKVKQIIGEIDSDAKDRLPKKFVRTTPPPAAPVERKSPLGKIPPDAKPGKVDETQPAKADKGDKGDKPDKALRAEKPDKPEKADKGERAEKVEKLERGGEKDNKDDKKSKAAHSSKPKVAASRLTRKKPK